MDRCFTSVIRFGCLAAFRCDGEDGKIGVGAAKGIDEREAVYVEIEIDDGHGNVVGGLLGEDAPDIVDVGGAAETVVGVEDGVEGRQLKLAVFACYKYDGA